MKNLKKELEKNFYAFKIKLKEAYLEAFNGLEGKDKVFLLSYRRLASLEAWRAFVLERDLTVSSLAFFKEAQNDAILSHAFARIGSWRTALNSLRGSIENILFCLYYKDHPIEYQLWERGRNQQPISDYIKYLERHPQFDSVPGKVAGISLLKKEYRTLSNAVHGSSKNFQMTAHPDKFPALMVPDARKLNQWAAREREVVKVINQLLLVMFAENLQGAKLRDLRKTISLNIPNKLHNDISSHLDIRLFKT